MSKTAPLSVTVFLALLFGLAIPVEARELTFEQRVQAQEAIERVYYSHQIGATRRFESAVPRELLERKVREYLGQSAALERFWDTPVTVEALQRELERIARQTRFPDRLRELYAAPGNDPEVAREGLARPVLVDRLTRNFFAFDRRIHAVQRGEGERLRADLVEGRLSILSSRARIIEYIRARAGG